VVVVVDVVEVVVVDVEVEVDRAVELSVPPAARLDTDSSVDPSPENSTTPIEAPAMATASAMPTTRRRPWIEPMVCSRLLTSLSARSAGGATTLRSSGRAGSST
jgi:hypothetical protein